MRQPLLRQPLSRLFTCPLHLWSVALLLLLAACGGDVTRPDYSSREGVQVSVFADLGRSSDANSALASQGVPVDPETGRTGVARAELEVYSGGAKLFFRDGRVVDETQGEGVFLTPDDSDVSLSLPAGSYRFALTAYDDREPANVLAKGEVEQRVSEESRVSVPLTSLLGSARLEVPEFVGANAVFDAFLRVSPPDRPDLRVPLGDYTASYEVDEPSMQLEGSSNIGVRVAAACAEVNVRASVDNDLSDAVSASASVPVDDDACNSDTDVGTDLVPPFVSVSTPAAGATVDKTFTLQGDVNDRQSGVDKVEVYEGTVKLGEAELDADTMTWSFGASLDNGQYTLIAVAFDRAGNTARAEVKLTVKEGAGGGDGGNPQTCTNPVNVPDPSIKQALKNILGLGADDEITCEMLAGLTVFFRTGTDGDDSDVDVSTLEGLQFAVNLEELIINDAVIQDYSAVASLAKLKTLRLSQLEAPSLAPLSNLSALTELELTGPFNGLVAEDVDALASLVNLENLSITNYGLGDLSPLQNLTKLSQLNLIGNGISDLSPLENLSELEVLYLGDNQISSIAPLQGLSQLYLLDLSDNQIGDLSPLQGLTELQSIELSGNPVTDISPLVENEGLTGNPGFNAVYLENTPLETCPGTQGRADIDTLIESGVQVTFDEPENCEGDNEGTITVTSTSSAASLEGECTLRAAITAANTDTAVGGCTAGDGVDTIVLTDESYTLTEVDNNTEGSNGLPGVTSDIILRGGTVSVERAENAPGFRFFYVAEGGNLTINGVTLRNGVATDSATINGGGGVFNAGTLTLENFSAILNSSANTGGGLYSLGQATLRDSSVSDNTSSVAGGIYNSGTLALVNSAVTNNFSDSSGGLYNEGEATIRGSIIEGNETGAIFNASSSKLDISDTQIINNIDDGGTLTNLGEMTLTNVLYDNNTDGVRNAEGATLNVADSTISNTGKSQGPGLQNGGTLSVENSTISGNLRGGVANTGTAEIVKSTIQGNSDPDEDRESQGVGISNGAAGTLTLTESTVSGNSGGGVTNSGEMEIAASAVQSNGPFSDGIVNSDGGTLSVVRSLVEGNGYYGIENAGALEVLNSTVTDNYFIGITNLATGTLDVAFSTVVDNAIESFVGSISNEADAGAVTVFGSILDRTTEEGFECSSPFATSKGYNLFFGGEPCGFTQDTDIVDVADYGISSVSAEDNGGPTQTLALEADSPALNHIPTSVCEVETDQRGVARPQGSACDIGAFERE